MTLQDLIDFHTTGAAACEAFAVTPAAGDAKYKDITKHYTKRAKWHRDAAALLGGLDGLLGETSSAMDMIADNTDDLDAAEICRERMRLINLVLDPAGEVKHTMRSVMEAYEAAQKHHLTGTSNFCAAMAASLNEVKP